MYFSEVSICEKTCNFNVGEEWICFRGPSIMQYALMYFEVDNKSCCPGSLSAINGWGEELGYRGSMNVQWNALYALLHDTSDEEFGRHREAFQQLWLSISEALELLPTPGAQHVQDVWRKSLMGWTQECEGPIGLQTGSACFV